MDRIDPKKKSWTDYTYNKSQRFWIYIHSIFTDLALSMDIIINNHTRGKISFRIEQFVHLRRSFDWIFIPKKARNIACRNQMSGFLISGRGVSCDLVAWQMFRTLGPTWATKKPWKNEKSQPSSKADRMKKKGSLLAFRIKEGGRCELKPGIIACVGDPGIEKSGNLFLYPKFGGFNTLFVQVLFL